MCEEVSGLATWHHMHHVWHEFGMSPMRITICCGHRSVRRLHASGLHVDVQQQQVAARLKCHDSCWEFEPKHVCFQSSCMDYGVLQILPVTVSTACMALMALMLLSLVLVLVSHGYVLGNSIHSSLRQTAWVFTATAQQTEAGS